MKNWPLGGAAGTAVRASDLADDGNVVAVLFAYPLRTWAGHTDPIDLGHRS